MRGVGRLTPLGQIDNYRNNWWCALQEQGKTPDAEGDGRPGNPPPQDGACGQRPRLPDCSPEGRRASGSPETACPGYGSELPGSASARLGQTYAGRSTCTRSATSGRAVHTLRLHGCEDHAVLQTSLSTIAQAVSTEPLDQADQVLVLRVSAGNLGSSSRCAQPAQYA